MSDPKRKIKIDNGSLSRLIAHMDLTGINDLDVPEEMEEAMAMARRLQCGFKPKEMYIITVPGLETRWPEKGEPGYDQMVANAMIMERTLH